MTWRPFSFLKPRNTDVEEEVRRLRGGLATAVVENDRKALELRQILQGSLALREGRGRETDR